MLTLLVVLATQTGRTASTDTIAGMVTGPGGRPLAGAIVQATSAITRLSRWQTSDAAGRFTIYFPGRAQYQLTAYYFGLVRGPGVGGVPLWARDDRRAASIRLELAGFANPIDTILALYGVLGLTGDQITRLRDIAASTHSFTLPELERVRNILTASQWTRLSTERPSAVTIRTQASSASPSPPPSPPTPSSQRPVRVTRPDVTLYTGVSTVYETNLTHAPTALDSYGVLLGGGGDFGYRSGHTTLEAHYDGVFRRYTGTDLWNVPGHEATVAIAQRVAKRWGVGAEAGVQLNGSAEDRVLRNEYSAQGELEYRPRGPGRFQLYVEYMLKRYPDALISHNAADPRVGLKYRRVLGATGTWGLGGRYDYNQADSSRHTYRGWTATTDVTLPMGSAGRISASFRYNIRDYPSRVVNLNSGDVLRRDADHVATIAWRQGIARVWDVVASYRFEYYGSNDPTRTFRDDLVAVTLTRNW